MGRHHLLEGAREDDSGGPSWTTPSRSMRLAVFGADLNTDRSARCWRGAARVGRSPLKKSIRVDSHLTCGMHLPYDPKILRREASERSYQGRSINWKTEWSEAFSGQID
jgi:hypothetical protein